MISDIRKTLAFLSFEGKEFSPYSWLLGEYINQRDKGPLVELFRERSVYCVGAGPSLGLVDTSEIKNSVVILLNSAYKACPCFGEYNEVVWYANDSARIKSMIQSVPKGIKKIVTVHKYRNVRKIVDNLYSEDFYLQPSIQLRKRKDGIGLLNLRPKYASEISHLESDYAADRIKIWPDSVMVNAVAMAVAYGAASVRTLGLDLPKVGEVVRYAKGVEPDLRAEGYNRERVAENLMKIRNFATDKNVDVSNNSPLSNLNVDFTLKR